MRVVLVDMPFSPIDLPSLGLGILKRAVEQTIPGARVDVLYANLEYVDWITHRTDFTGADYDYYSASTYFIGCGDWVFSSALYDDPAWKLKEFTEVMGDALGELGLNMTRELHASAPQFIRELAERIVAESPDVVGFTTTFIQKTASLAAAREIKRLVPHVVTVIGGANCDAEQGAAVHRNFPFVDFVVRGEGEVAFPRLLTALCEEADSYDIPGLCRRAANGTSVAVPMSTTPLPPAAIVSPDYGAYFERLATSVARDWIEPKLIVEGSRGCWWGQKHHCTFCGLNGSFMEYRSKSPAAFYKEIISLVQEHRVMDIYVVDNILDMGYISSLLPRIIESGYDLRMYVEVKANLRKEQLQALADAGIVYVQPGIESLNSRVLGLMDKGVSGCQNVRLLRDGAETGLTLFWNYLRGFPGERDEDYDPIIAQMPALEHLAPPGDLSNRIAVVRFSPYFTKPELGFSETRPERHYALTYDLPEDELYDLAYVFESRLLGIGGATIERLNEALNSWINAYPASRLSHVDLGNRIFLISRRRAFDWTTLELADPMEVAAFRLLDQPHSLAALTRKLEQRLPQRPPPEEATVVNLLVHWQRLGLIFAEGGQYIHLAPRAVNENLLRLGPKQTTGVADAAEVETAASGVAQA